MFDIGYKGAGVLIYSIDGENKVSVLLGKRTCNPGRGLWSIPGGGWEYDDKTLVDTARREMMEETGFNLPEDKKNLLHEMWSMDVFAFKFKVFAIRIKKKKFPRSCFEFSMTKWFDINHIPAEEQCNKFLHSQISNLKKFLVKNGKLLAV